MPVELKSSSAFFMTFLKIFVKFLKFCTFILALSICLILCCYLTHPSFVEENLVKTWPEYKNTKFTFKRGFETCDEYTFYPAKLDDKYYDYIWNSDKQKFGNPLVKKEQIKDLFLAKKLEYVDSSEVYVVDTLYHSFSFLTKESKKLLNEIGTRFQSKLRNTHFQKARILITSLLRTQKSIKKLMRRNKNSVKTSSHLHGTTFDIAHHEFVAHKTLNEAENRFLRLTLAETLQEFRENDRCFVTYESRQACFHVVNKMKI